MSVFASDMTTDGPSDPVSLRSAVHGITLNYLNLNVGDETSIFSLRTPNQISCEVTTYNVDIYRQSDLNYATMENTSSLMSLYHYEFEPVENEETIISIPSSSLDGFNYFRISASSSANLSCVLSAYYYNIPIG